MASTSVASDPFPSDSDKQNVTTNNVSVTNPNFEPTLSSSDALTFSPQSDCVFSLVRDSVCGAIAGSVVGFGSGLIENQGFKGSVAQAGSYAKMFTVHSCVQGFVESCLKSIRGKHDVYSAGVAGCAAGIALSFQGGSHTPLPSCILFGVVSSMLEDNKQRQSTMVKSYESLGQQVNGIIPSLSLPLPNELKESFSSFCKSLHEGPH